MINGLLFEVGLLNQQVARCIEYLLGSIKTDALDSIDNPLVNLIRELIQVDILIGLILVYLTEYIDGIFCKHRSQFDVHTATADSQTNFLRLQVNLCFLVLIINID